MKLIIFDVYGTLISTGSGSVDAVRKILSLQNKNINAEQFYKEWKIQHRIHMDYANNDNFINEEKIFALDLKQLYLKYDICRDWEADVSIMLDTLGKRKCFDETVSSINKLREKYRVVIGSTTDNKSLLKDMERNGLAVDEIYTSETIRKYKPDPGFYSFILQNEKCSKEEAIFVGDSYLDDVLGPERVGIRAILIDRKNNFRYEENEIKPWKVINSLSKVEEIAASLLRED